MKKLICLLFALIIAVMINSCSKDEDTKNDSNQIDDPLEVKENVLVKKITRTDAQGDVQTVDFIYDGNKIVSIETDEEIHSFFYSGNLIIRREVFNKEFTTTEITNYTYNGKVLKTSNNLTFVNNNGEFMTFSAPDETITTSSSSNLYKYRGRVDFRQNLVYEYITIFENYDLLRYGDNRPATIDQNNYRYFYDENKNPFNNIIGMEYLLNNDNRLRFGVLHLLNGNCKRNINKVEAYSFLTFWGNPTSVTEAGAVFTYDRVYTYNELNYPTAISEKIFKRFLGNTTMIADNIVYNFDYY
jgi:hypothetical protein